ncbi:MULTISPECIES: hypothetical protein [Rhizobium]|uniref:hypothetical protein n=1 Tax=Rhizobium TaxID=379 RepID=UPI0023A940F4|nr:hypothetical protein [Rhizobium sp. MJ22]WEA27818.1 hypothetical protein PO862_11065 [Rhizobium sp. MJ22]
MPDIRDIRRPLLAIINGIRLDVLDGRRSFGALEDRLVLGERLERFRLILAEASRRRHLEPEFKDTLLYALNDLTREVLARGFEAQKFRLRTGDVAAIHEYIPPMVLENGEVGEILLIAYELIESVPTYEIMEELNNIDRLGLEEVITKREASRRLNIIVPDDVVSPVRFDFVESKLVVAHTAAIADQSDASTVAAARAALIEQGDRVLENLRQSNCDRRLLEAFEKLHEKLTHEEDVVQLGVLNISCEHMAADFKDELSTAVGSMVRAQSAAISLYVAHFPQWRTFSEKALLLELSPEDIAEVKSAALRISDQFERDSQNIDEEVPKTIRYFASLIDDPFKASKRTGYALITSLENLLAKLFSIASEFLSETVSKTSKALSTWTARVIVAFVVSTALNTGAELSPIFRRFQTTAWVQRATEILDKVELPGE